MQHLVSEPGAVEPAAAALEALRSGLGGGGGGGSALCRAGGGSHTSGGGSSGAGVEGPHAAAEHDQLRCLDKSHGHDCCMCVRARRASPRPRRGLIQAAGVGGACFPFAPGHVAPSAA
jgi:hypothetical protein